MVYLTTDSERFKRKFIDSFEQGRVLVFNDSSAHLAYDFNKMLGGTSGFNKVCKKNRNTLLDFLCLSECDMGAVSHSGFGVVGIWNRPEPNKELYVYSTLEFIMNGVISNKGLRFIRPDNLDTFYFPMTKGVIL
jgi:hypothetical protein